MFQDRSTNSKAKNNLIKIPSKRHAYISDHDASIPHALTPHTSASMHAPHAQLAVAAKHAAQHSSGGRAQCELLAGGRPRLSVRLVCSGCSLGSPNAAGQVATGAAAVEQAAAALSSIGTGRRTRGIFLSS